MSTYSSLRSNLVILRGLVLEAGLPSTSGSGIHEALDATLLSSRSGSSRSSVGSSGSASGGRTDLATLLALDEALRTTIELADGSCRPSLETVLGLKLLQSLGWQHGGAVVNTAGVVDFVNRDGGVDNLGSDGLLLDHWLNVLVQVMVDVLALNGGCNGRRVLSVMSNGAVAVLGGISIESGLGLLGLVMFKSLVLDSRSVVNVLLSAKECIVSVCAYTCAGPVHTAAPGA